MTQFDPKPGTQIRLGAKQYNVLPHPVVKSMAFGQEGRKAIVYQLRSNGHLHALKIFKHQFRDPSIIDTCNKLSLLDLPGLDVCQRECFTRSSMAPLINQYPELEYAVLMPWIQGSTWFDIVASSMSITKDASKKLAKNTAEVLASLEKRGYAHCDIAAANVIVNTGTGQVNFIDVEDMFGPGLPQPGSFPQGTDGYQHKTSRANSKGQWRATGDRFAAAILLAEMLAWHSPDIRKAADEEHYFPVHELQDPSSANYQLMMSALTNISSKIARNFERAWHSNSLDECPSLSEWVNLLEFPYVEEWISIITPPPPPPYKPSFSEPIGYKPTSLDPKDWGSNPIIMVPDTPKLFRNVDAKGQKFQWEIIPFASGYIIEQSQTATFVNAKEVYRGNNTEWINPEQLTSTTYYRIRAYNFAGKSQWSKVVSVDISSD